MKYDVVLADPPWKFRTWSPKGDGRKPPYPTMTVADIAALPIQQYRESHAVLFLWVTWPFLEDAFRVLQAWGFRYRTNAWVWKKSRINKGYYTRKMTEVCLLGVRGSMGVARRDIDDFIETPAVGPHSRKPAEQYDRIEALYPGRRYLELFATENRPGWHAWGNQVESDIALSLRLPEPFRR